MTLPAPHFADLSPVRLSYAAALRGVIPRDLSAPFAYAAICPPEPGELLCLAASNPGGRFYGILTSHEAARTANGQALKRKVHNVTFGADESVLPPVLDYLCIDASGSGLLQGALTESLALAETRLSPGGIVAIQYAPTATPDDSLRFLLAELAPEMEDAAIPGFLQELKQLGARYFDSHPIARGALDRALADGAAGTFVSACLQAGEDPASKTFDILADLLPRGFTFAGDAQIGANYLELAAPQGTHDALAGAQDHLLYECIKDFVTGRSIRQDVWVKLPAEQSDNKPTLFNPFTFGLGVPADHVPARLCLETGEIDLTTPLFSSLLSLMALLPLGVGDFLSHDSGKAFSSEDVLSALQILVAAGIAAPMRGRYQGIGKIDTSHPALATPFNQTIRDMTIETAQIPLASVIVGGQIVLPLREALVLQAVTRVGLPSCAGALMLEVRRLAEKNPALAAQIMDSPTPTDESVHRIIESTLSQGLVRWYAYGLLAA